MLNWDKLAGFEWDKGNIAKSYQKHGISSREAEEVFLDESLQILKDVKHSQRESRYIAVGKDFSGGIIFIVFTIRNSKVRVISARPANIKERQHYEQAVKENSTF